MMSANMKGRRAFLVAALLSLLAVLTPRSTPAIAQGDEEVVVLLNARNPTQNITKAELGKLLLGQTAFWHGVVPVKVFVRPDGSLTAKTAYATLLNMTPQAYRKHWDELQLSGRGVAPKQVAAIQELAQAVASAPGAVSYALASEAWGLNVKGVKVVQVR